MMIYDHSPPPSRAAIFISTYLDWKMLLCAGILPRRRPTKCARRRSDFDWGQD